MGKHVYPQNGTKPARPQRRSEIEEEFKTFLVKARLGLNKRDYQRLIAEMIRHLSKELDRIA